MVEIRDVKARDLRDPAYRAELERLDVRGVTWWSGAPDAWNDCWECTLDGLGTLDGAEWGAVWLGGFHGPWRCDTCDRRFL